MGTRKTFKLRLANERTEHSRIKKTQVFKTKATSLVSVLGPGAHLFICVPALPSAGTIQKCNLVLKAGIDTFFFSDALSS